MSIICYNFSGFLHINSRSVLKVLSSYDPGNFKLYQAPANIFMISIIIDDPINNML